MSWFSVFRKYKYNVKLHDTGYHSTRKDNWREIVKWCEQTFDKEKYTCDIVMNDNSVYKVFVRFKQKEDYTQFVIAWC